MSRFYQCFLLLFGLTFSWLIPTAQAEQDAPNTVHYEEDIYFYHTDHLGGTRYITDKNGDVVESILTFPGGEPWVNQTIRRSADDYKTPYTFTGKEQDASGLYYYGARYYDPRAQIWASVDPILNEYLGNDPSKLPGMGGIFNSRNLGMYSYSFNNPFNLFDPDGNSTKSNYERNLENWAAANGSTVEQERAKRKQRNNEREAFVADAATTGVSAALMFVSFEKVAGWVSNFAQMAKAKVLNMMGKNAPKGLKGGFGPTYRKADSEKLENILTSYYGKDKTGNRVGNGGLADALRHEKATGELLSPSGHGSKAVEMKKRLNSLIQNADNQPPGSYPYSKRDIDFARELVRDLDNAINF